MSGTDDLKELLDRLKSEVRDPGPELPPSFSGPAAARTPAAEERVPAAKKPPRQERFGAPPRPEFLRQAHGHSTANTNWSENKETMLFGMLISVVVLLGGIAASLFWLTAVGAAFFALFGAITAWTLFGYARDLKGAVRPGVAELSARVDQLARLVLRVASDQEASAGGANGSNMELERKVEELRTIVKSLAKAVEERDR
jgi:hypothetical protein